MSTNKRYLYASIILGVVLVIIVLFIYFSSAKFIDQPEILLPSESTSEQQKIEYENQIILQDITIDEQNYKDVIEKLTRPLVYSMSVLNEIYAFDAQKSQITSVSVSEDSIVAIRDNTEYKVVDDIIYITRNEQTVEFDRLDFSDDEIIGIPSYEQLLDIQSDEVNIAKTTLSGEQVISIEILQEQTTEIYTISLVTGMLMQYRVLIDDEVVRNVIITNLLIGENVE